MRFNPTNPAWANRDRFVLSAGHGSMLLYALLYLTGYDLPLDELRNFRQWGSKTPGHPEYGHTPGVETTTGPLGQGFANGVGMALAERWLAERFNRPDYDIVDHYIYAIVSDGDLMEGVASEAASLAGHLQAGQDCLPLRRQPASPSTARPMSRSPRIGPSASTPTAGTYRMWTAPDARGHLRCDWRRRRSDPRPSIIGCRSIIGYGSPNNAGTSKVHGEPLGEEELAATKENLGWPQEPRFFVPDDVLALFRRAVDFGRTLEAEYETLLCCLRRRTIRRKPPNIAQLIAGDLPAGWEESIPVFTPGGADATRNASGKVINAVAGTLPNLVGGSADLAGSNKTTITGQPFIDAESFAGPNIHFGVREHGMAGILNGMALHGGLIPYGATFLVFSDYMRGSMRLAALMGYPCHLRVDPRQHWSGRRWADPPAHRAAGRSAHHPQYDGYPAC